MERKRYPSDGSDDAWALGAPYLTLITEEAPQGVQSLREVFHGLRWLVRAGAAWRASRSSTPPGCRAGPRERGVASEAPRPDAVAHGVPALSQRWLKAGVCVAMVHHLRAVLRVA